MAVHNLLHLPLCNALLPLPNMLLTIDIGNSRTKALVFGKDGRPAGRLITERSTPEFIEQLLAAHPHKPIAVASVMRLDDTLLQKLNDRHALVVDGSTPLPISSAYATPSTLGVDRICAAVGAHALFPLVPVLAIDMGTCITYDVVTTQGRYMGGSISPGLHMRFKALNSFTSKLPLVQPEPIAPAIGTTTEQCIRAGVQQGIRMELQGVIAQHSEAYPGLRTVGTGGDLSLFVDDLKTPIFADPILVLRGLHDTLLHNL